MLSSFFRNIFPLREKFFQAGFPKDWKCPGFPRAQVYDILVTAPCRCVRPFSKKQRSIPCSFPYPTSTSATSTSPGQCFRWEPLGQDTYRIPAFGRTLTVRQTDGVFDFSCGAGEFDALWRSYFDLDTDYAAIKARVAPRDAYLQAAVAYGWGMRILRQDLWEVIVSFIVSQNNNIPRIRKNLRDLCAMQGGAFPTPAALAAAQPETLRALGLGYRAEYLCAAGAHFTQAARWMHCAPCPIRKRTRRCAP